MIDKEEISKLTNEDLSKELRKLNISVGPITSTTRRIYENRLHLYLERIRKQYLDKEDSEKSKEDSEKSKEDSEKSKEVSCVNTQNNLDTETYKDTHNGCTDSNDKDNSKTKIDTKQISENKVDNTMTNNINNNNTETSVQKEEEKRDGFFYGVWVPYSPTRVVNKNKPNVFFSQKSALTAMKRFNGSRFKQFKTKEEAEQFSLTEPQTLSVDKIILMVAKGVAQRENNTVKELKNPTLQEIQKFRVYIEVNDIQSVQECLQNSKYLINTKDIPVIVHEGSRLNAMHIAVKFNKLSICELIMNKLDSSETYQLIYPDITEECLEFRKNHLMNLYLNSPEKIICDTSLHLACKYGFIDIVKFLLSFPSLNINATNKDGKRASEIICSRANVRGPSKKELTQEILSLFEDKVYVPLYQGETMAKIGQPIVTVSPKASSVLTTNMRACVGPLSPSQAHSFYHLWRKSPRDKKYQAIVRTDYEKGMERIGRSLSTEENVQYVEYWDFLKCFTNLSSTEGLDKLEIYLQSKSERLQENSSKLKILEDHEASPLSIPTTNQRDITIESDLVKRRLSFDNELPSLKLDMENLTVGFKTACTVREEPSPPKKTDMPYFYIYGDRPSKQDMDVLRAIEDFDCDVASYPYISKWQKRLQIASVQDRESWPSPGTPRYKSFLSTKS